MKFLILLSILVMTVSCGKRDAGDTSVPDILRGGVWTNTTNGITTEIVFDASTVQITKSGPSITTTVDHYLAGKGISPDRINFITMNLMEYWQFQDAQASSVKLCPIEVAACPVFTR